MQTRNQRVRSAGTSLTRRGGERPGAVPTDAAVLEGEWLPVAAGFRRLSWLLPPTQNGSCSRCLSSAGAPRRGRGQLNPCAARQRQLGRRVAHRVRRRPDV
eukprot:353707-Chlamydomonas_euryale.AAC.19